VNKALHIARGALAGILLVTLGLSGVVGAGIIGSYTFTWIIEDNHPGAQALGAILGILIGVSGFVGAMIAKDDYNARH
jgi:hypothetical protein